MKYRAFIAILESHGFAFHRQGATSHRIYRGVVDGRVMLVTVAYHRESDEILPKTLASMIRQSGLSKQSFK